MPADWMYRLSRYSNAMNPYVALLNDHVPSCLSIQIWRFPMEPPLRILNIDVCDDGVQSELSRRLTASSRSTTRLQQ